MSEWTGLSPSPLRAESTAQCAETQTPMILSDRATGTWRDAQGQYLVQVAESHPLDGGCLPLGKGRHELDGGGLLLQHPQGQRAQNGVALVDERLARGAGVHSYHFTP